VEAILDLSVDDAEQHGEALRLAVEWIELAPTLQKTPPDAIAKWFASTDAKPDGLPGEIRLVSAVRQTTPAAAARMSISKSHPRAASLRWLALRHALTTGIPDGWSAEDIRQATPKGFGDLQKQLDAWLADYPDHPLADYVRLKKVRLHYLSGEADAAWAVLLDLYDEHPARVANEMRFLYKQSVEPTKVDFATLPPEIAAGLAHRASPEEWSALWKRTEAEKDAAWAVPLQEKLLLAAQDDGTLPEAFPKEAAAPTDAWAVLRFAALERAGRWDEAWAQLEKLDPKGRVAGPARTRLLLQKGDWVGAIRNPNLDPAAMRYLIRVLAPEEALVTLADDERQEIRWEARLALASRDLSEGTRWKKAAKWLAPVDPDRAALWKQADALSRKKSADDVLAYARFLRENGGFVFVGNEYEDVVFYRSLPNGAGEGRAELGITGEDAAIAAWLKRSFATWYSVEAYARYLQLVDPASFEARAGLDEADRTYNVLLNYGSGDYHAWGSILPDSQPARDIRAAGKVIRATTPSVAPR
jgi:hypothetical protein